MVLPPFGKPMLVYFRKGQDKLQVVTDVILPRWEKYCNENWLSDNHEDPWCAERRVKTYLDSVGYLLLRDNPEGTLTLYKECARGSSEIPVSSCPADMSDIFYADGATLHDCAGMTSDQFSLMLEELDEAAAKYAKPKSERQRAKKAKVSTRFETVESIKRQYPGSRFTFCRVDTDNRFLFEGEAYGIDESVEAYRLTETAEGDWYAMDQIVVVRDTEGDIHFYDQWLRPLYEDLIYPIGA